MRTQEEAGVVRVLGFRGGGERCKVYQKGALRSARLQTERAPADARNDMAVAVCITRTVRHHQFAVALKCTRHVQVLRSKHNACQQYWYIRCIAAKLYCTRLATWHYTDTSYTA